MTIRPLRGRVVIRPEKTVRIGNIVLPGSFYDYEIERDQRKGVKAMSSHRGIVLAMGAPARTSLGIEVPPDFKIGDQVVFVWKHNEKEYTKPWDDGKPAAWVAQEHVLAVFE